MGETGFRRHVDEPVFLCLRRAASHESAWFRVPERRNNATIPTCPPVPVHLPPSTEGGREMGAGAYGWQRRRPREPESCGRHQRAVSLVKLCNFPIECDRRAKRGRLAFGQQETIRGVDLHGLAVFLGEMMAARMGGEGGRQTATPSRSQDDWTPWFGIDEATPAADYASAREWRGRTRDLHGAGGGEKILPRVVTAGKLIETRRIGGGRWMVGVKGSPSDWCPLPTNGRNNHRACSRRRAGDNQE